MPAHTCKDCPREISPGAARCFQCTGRFNAGEARDRRVRDYLELIDLGLSPYDAAIRVGVTSRTIYRWRNEGRVP